MLFLHAGHSLPEGADDQREGLDKAYHSSCRHGSRSDVLDIIAPKLTGCQSGNRFRSREDNRVSAKQSDERHQHEPAQGAAGEHIAGNLRPADEAHACQGRQHLDAQLGTGIALEGVANLAGEQLQAVRQKLVKSGNAKAREYGSGLRSAFLSCQKHLRAGGSFREGQGSVLLHDQGLP